MEAQPAGLYHLCWRILEGSDADTIQDECSQSSQLPEDNVVMLERSRMVPRRWHELPEQASWADAV